MGSLRAAPRPSSPSSVASSNRSSFESRTKSPLSISSSVDNDNDDTASLNSYNGRPDLAPTRLPGKTNSQQITSEILSNARVGSGKGYRQQAPQHTVQMRVMPILSAQQKPVIRRPPLPPGVLFRRLPEEVLLVILAQLKNSHTAPGSTSCSTCWMREALDLGRSCKKWWNAARQVLYEDIQLIGCDSLVHTKKRYKMKYGTRLILLRRTLRARPDYAQYVKSLKVPKMPENALLKSEQDDYLDLVATVIMACPNLERLPGFYPSYTHEFSRFVHALSSRPKLKEMVWIINPSRFQRQHRYKVSEDMSQLAKVVSIAPGPLLPQQSVDFLTYHSNWSNLTTLFLQCNPGGMIDSLLFEDVFHSLPKLENLYISNFPANAFNDSTLVSLPPLRSLRLDRLPGVTCDGLSAFASARQRHSLKSLSLIQIPLLSLPVLARLLSNFRSLINFTISQSPAPSLPPGEIIFLHPYLASFSIQRLHWEFTNADRDTATGILAKSIEFGGFPSLRNIRSPTDFEGLLQMQCRPRDRIELPSDKYRNLKTPSHTGLPQTQSSTSLPSPTKNTFGPPSMSSPTRSTFFPSPTHSNFLPSPTRSTFSLGHNSNTSVSSSIMKSPSRSVNSQPGDYFSYQPDDIEYKPMSLVTARRMAQNRIEASTTQPQFHIIVWDDFGHFQERFEVGGFIGKVDSKIFYSLKPDVAGMDEGVVQFEGIGGLLDVGEETSTKEGCTGSWWLDAEARKSDKNAHKKRDVWWHTDRGRWKELPLEKFF